MKDKTVWTLGVVALAIVVVSLVLVFSQPEPLHEKIINASLTISKRPGLNLDGSSLGFGQMPPNGSIKRSVRVNNPYDFDVYAHSSVKGNITPFLNYKPITAIPKNQSLEVEFLAKAPNKSYKEVNKTYSGNVSIKLWKAEDLR